MNYFDGNRYTFLFGEDIWGDTSGEQAGGGGIGGQYAADASSGGTVATTLTWVPAAGKTIQTDPPSEPVNIIETAWAGWSTSGVTPTDEGDASDGLGDQKISIPPIYGYGQTSSGTHLTQKDGSSGTITLAPTSMEANTPFHRNPAIWGYAEAGCSFGVTIDTDPNPMNVVPVRVDATDPHNARVYYRTEPASAIVQTATFTAPAPFAGGYPTTQTRSNLSGEFSFTFDEAQLPLGTSTFTLQWTPASPFTAIPGGGTITTTAANTSYTALGSSPLGAWVLAGDPDATPSGGPNGGLQRVPMTPYDLYEYYNKFSYSLAVVPESKTIYAASSNVNLGTQDFPSLPSRIIGWHESHHYHDDLGDYAGPAMTSPVGATLPAQTLWFQSKSSSSGLFFAPNHHLIGVAHCDDLLFGSDEFQGVVVPAFLDSAVSDTRTIIVDMD